MHYSIRHVTKFRYSAPISESFMELRMQPRTEATQHCVWFDLSIIRVALTSYRDDFGNLVSHSRAPSSHSACDKVGSCSRDRAAGHCGGSATRPWQESSLIAAATTGDADPTASPVHDYSANWPASWMSSAATTRFCCTRVDLGLRAKFEYRRSHRS